MPYGAPPKSVLVDLCFRGGADPENQSFAMTTTRRNDTMYTDADDKRKEESRISEAAIEGIPSLSPTNRTGRMGASYSVRLSWDVLGRLDYS
jgi:hypothetical protein